MTNPTFNRMQTLNLATNYSIFHGGNPKNITTLLLLVHQGEALNVATALKGRFNSFLFEKLKK